MSIKIYKSKYLALCCSLIVLSLCSMVSVAQEVLLQPFEGTLTNEQQAVYNNLQANPVITRVEVAHIDAKVLESPLLRLNLFEDVDEVAERVNIGTIGSSAKSWIGTFEEKLGTATLIWYDKGRIQGQVTSIDGNFELFGQGDGVTFIVENDVTQHGTCGGEYERTSLPDVPIDLEKSLDNDMGFPNNSHGVTHHGSSESSGVECLIRIILAYTSGAQSSALSDFGQTMVERTALAVAGCNTAYFNSLVDQRMEIAHLYETSTNEGGSYTVDIDDLQTSTDGRWDEIHSKRDFYDADMCGLITDDVYSGIFGVAWWDGSTFDYTNAATMFQLSEQASIVSNFTMDHEFGHSRGCRHDTDPGTTPFSYGHGYNQGSIFRTIMAVNSFVTRVNYWSNPSINFPGGGGAMGVFGDSDNESALDVGDFTVAHHRQTPATFSTGILVANDEVLNMYTTGTLTSTNDAASGSEITLKSRAQVRLAPGFHAMNGSTGRVYIETCTSVYDRLAGEDNGSVDEPLAAVNGFDLYPNPADQSAAIQFELQQDATVHAALFDIRGREVITLINSAEMGEGVHNVNINTSELAAGTYYCKVVMGDESSMTKLVVVH